MNEVERFINHVDDVRFASREIFKLGASCALYFDLSNKYEIPESELELLKSEISKRDHGTPSITIHQNKILHVIISKPWTIDIFGNIKETIEIITECVINNS